MKTRNNKAVLFAALISFVAGCTGQTAQERQAVLDSWIGANAQDLVDSWGYPSNQLTAPDGNTVYVYHWEQHSPDIKPQWQRGLPDEDIYGGEEDIYGGEEETYNLTFTCDTSFEIDKNQTVVQWTTRGTRC